MTTIQTLRHEAKDTAREVKALLVGTPGMTKEEQVERLAEAKALAEALFDTLSRAKELAETRDFEAHQAEKHQLVSVPFEEDEFEDEFEEG